jgi:hypothetical protein
MKATITETSIPIIEHNCVLAMTVYKVDWESYQVVGYHESVTSKGTFGVYERREVAEYVKTAIENGEIKPFSVEADYTYPDD